MVYRQRDAIPPSDFTHKKWDIVREQAIIDGGTHKAHKALYRGTTIDTLIELYANKCSYCERSRGYEIQVDHYRPTKTRNYQTDIEYNQPGYYWLAYIWSNLLPLCSKCNQEKSNKFPLEGYVETLRISSHIPIPPQTITNIEDLTWLNNYEKPLLLHPELEPNPARHFIFLNNGRIKLRTIVGEETERILQLNRKDLIRERKQIIDNLVKDISRCISEFIASQNIANLEGGLNVIFHQIVRGTVIDHEFSLFYTFIYKYFEYYIGSHLNNRMLAMKIQEYFTEFKIQNDLM